MYQLAFSYGNHCRPLNFFDFFLWNSANTGISKLRSIKTAIMETRKSNFSLKSY